MSSEDIHLAIHATNKSTPAHVSHVGRTFLLPQWRTFCTSYRRGLLRFRDRCMWINAGAHTQPRQLQLGTCPRILHQTCLQVPWIRSNPNVIAHNAGISTSGSSSISSIQILQGGKAMPHDVKPRWPAEPGSSGTRVPDEPGFLGYIN